MDVEHHVLPPGEGPRTEARTDPWHVGRAADSHSALRLELRTFWEGHSTGAVGGGMIEFPQRWGVFPSWDCTHSLRNIMTPQEPVVDGDVKQYNLSNSAQSTPRIYF